MTQDAERVLESSEKERILKNIEKQQTCLTGEESEPQRPADLKFGDY